MDQLYLLHYIQHIVISTCNQNYLNECHYIFLTHNKHVKDIFIPGHATFSNSRACLKRAALPTSDKPRFSSSVATRGLWLPRWSAKI